MPYCPNCGNYEVSSPKIPPQPLQGFGPQFIGGSGVSSTPAYDAILKAQREADKEAQGKAARTWLVRRCEQRGRKLLEWDELIEAGTMFVEQGGNLVGEIKNDAAQHGYDVLCGFASGTWSHFRRARLGEILRTRR